MQNNRASGSRLQASAFISKYLACSLQPVACSLFFVYLLLTMPCLAKDKIVAVVNKEVITQKDLTDFMNFMRLQLSREFSGEVLEKKLSSLETDLLDRLIEDRLVLQEAKRTLEEANKNKDLYTAYHLTIDPTRVKARINEIKKHYLTEREFQQDLTRQGLAQADLEQKIKEEMLTHNIVQIKVRDKIKIRPEEVTSFYNQNQKDFFVGEGREVEVFSLENMDLATTFSYGLKSAEKLTDLATRYPFTVNTVTITRSGQFREDITEAVFKLAVQEVSEPLEVDGKLYVFRLLNIIPPRQLALSEIQDRIYSLLLEKKMQEAMVSWIDELKKKSYIKIMDK